MESSEYRPTGDSPQDVELQSAIELVRGRLQDAVKQYGFAPIEEFLLEFPSEIRTKLLSELIAEEIRLRKGLADFEFDLGEYTRRFPSKQDELSLIWQQVSSHSQNTKVEQSGSPNASCFATMASDPPSKDANRSRPLSLAELNRYRIVREIGRGGMGAVYEAWDERLERRLAIKLVAQPSMSQRTDRELKLLAQVNSNYVVKLFDVVDWPDGSLGICMELVQGGDLQRLIANNSASLDEGDILEFMRQACMGMIAVADQGVIHRDLKPSNILLDESNCVKVADFGLARTINPVDNMTGTSIVLGTPLYMSPEQAEDPRAADSRSDIYSFGATFYHVATGAPPFSGASAFSVLYKHKTEPLRSPRALKPSLSERMCEILERCLAKVPEDRFQTFKDLLHHLSPVSPTSLSPWEHLGSADLGEVYLKFQQRLAGYLEETPVTDPAIDSFDCGNGRCIRIVSGDISECDTDAIVSSDDEYLSMGGGVSWAIRRRAGLAFEEQVKSYGRVRTGRSVVTTGGNLKAKYVIHGVTLGMDAMLSRDVIADIVRSVYYHAETLNLTSVAFPMLGTGVGGFSKSVCLETMFRVIARIMSHGLTSVQDTKIVLFNPKIKSQKWYRV